MQRLNILPRAHIDDARLRPVRDLLRRRTNLVQQRRALLLSFKSLYHRTTGQALALKQLKPLSPSQGAELDEHPAHRLIAQVQPEHIRVLTKSIGQIEKAVMAGAGQLPMYWRLLSLPGVGRILGMTIALEVGDIRRFATDGDFASYCRAVDSRKLSNVTPMAGRAAGATRARECAGSWRRG